MTPRTVTALATVLAVALGASLAVVADLRMRGILNGWDEYQGALRNTH